MPKGIYMDGDYCNVHRFKEAKFDPATGLSKQHTTRSNDLNKISSRNVGFTGNNFTMSRF